MAPSRDPKYLAVGPLRLYISYQNLPTILNIGIFNMYVFSLVKFDYHIKFPYHIQIMDFPVVKLSPAFASFYYIAYVCFQVAL